MRRHRSDQRDVVVGAVREIPEVRPSGDSAEVPALRERVRPVVHVVEVPSLEANRDGFVLEQLEPRRISLVVDDEARAEHDERAAGPQHGRGLRKLDVGVEPVERVEGDDRVEELASRVPAPRTTT